MPCASHVPRYLLYPPYAPSREDVLRFRYTPSAGVQLLESEFAKRLPEEMLKAHLHSERPSVPAFLSAVTLALHEQG